MGKKLVKQGTATMMVSLPSKWIRENNLDKGDEVEVEEKDNSIIINTRENKENKKKQETVISPKASVESSLRTLITNSYRSGYDSVKVKYNSQEELRIIEETVSKNLLGFETVSKEKNYCFIENITEPSSDQFENVFNKLLLSIEELFNILIDNKKQENPEEIERQIQKFDNFCRRVTAKTEKRNKAKLRYTFHNELVHAQREIYFAIRYINSKKISIEKEAMDLIKSSFEQFKLLKEAYQNNDISLLEKVHENEKNLVYKKGYKLLQSSKEPALVYHIISSIRNFYLSSSPLIGLLL